MSSSESNIPNLRIPIIDFSVQPLKPETAGWESERSQIRQALEEFGCFEALFDKISMDIRRETLEAIKELMDLPLETKQLLFSNKPFQSYTFYEPKSRDELLSENVTIDDANILQNVESFANMSWPQGNPSFCKAIQSYSDQLSELDQIIWRMIFESLGIENYFEQHMELINYSLRLTKSTEDETSGTKKQALRSHTDKGFMNILNQNQVDGLEVQTKDGQWIPVEPSSSGSFVVILGQALSCVLANGRLHSPLHRVMMTGNKTRYSFGLGSTPKEDYLIKTPEELVDEEHPLMFKPYYFSEFLKFFGTDGKFAESALKAYCGV